MRKRVDVAWFGGNAGGVRVATCGIYVRPSNSRKTTNEEYEREMF